jgi:hypothetical protein
MRAEEDGGSLMRRKNTRRLGLGQVGVEESTLRTTREKLARAVVLAGRAAAEADKARQEMPADYARLQQAAQKGWTAASVAVDALILHRTGQRPKGTERRLDELSDLAQQDNRVEPLDRDFNAFLGYLHATCGHEGTCSTKLVPRKLAQVQRFVEEVAELIRGS